MQTSTKVLLIISVIVLLAVIGFYAYCDNAHPLIIQTKDIFQNINKR